MTKAEMKFQAQLEEYKQLRAEILCNQRASGTNRILLILAYSAAIPLAFSFSNPAPAILLGAAVIALILWSIEIWRIIAVHEIATYIEVVLEKEVDGLDWEHHFLRVRKGVYLSQFIVALLFFIPIVFSVAVSGWMLFATKTDIPSIYLLILRILLFVLAIGSIITLVNQLRLSQRRERTREQMEKIHKELEGD